jgi:hypothetical protein
MTPDKPSEQHERTAAVENAGFKWAYQILCFGLLMDCVYRRLVRGEDVRDLFGLAAVSVVVLAAYWIRYGTAGLRKKLLFTYIVPRIRLAELPELLAFTVAGALVAGCYGIAHDQITFSIGPEYFRNFKFHQFHYADLGLGERVFVSCIGFLATWWVGAIGGWILARRILSTCPAGTAYRRISAGFLVVFASAAAGCLLGFFYGLWRGPNADYSAWQPALEGYRVADVWSFMRVAYIHNAGYIGAAIGLLSTYVVIRPGDR